MNSFHRVAISVPSRIFLLVVVFDFYELVSQGGNICFFHDFFVCFDSGILTVMGLYHFYKE